MRQLDPASSEDFEHADIPSRRHPSPSEDHQYAAAFWSPDQGKHVHALPPIRYTPGMARLWHRIEATDTNMNQRYLKATRCRVIRTQQLR
jgi:hypothetical protein